MLSRLAKKLPILHWLPRYNKKWLRADFIAGASVWALMVPEALAYAGIAGVPPAYGLYAAAAALILRDIEHIPSRDYRAEHPDSETYPGLAIIRFDGPLYFATINALNDRVKKLSTDVEPPVKWLVFDMEAINFVDLEGADMLKAIIKKMKKKDIEFHLARVRQPVLDFLKEADLNELLGDENVHADVNGAVTAFKQRSRRPDAA